MTKAAQLDREIAEALSARGGSGKRPLYGHTSESTAYVVADYPYGFTARTQIRYWLEKKAKKGWRLVSQTMNPKTQRWNKPKASTYVDWGAAMYLDDKGHVAWDGVGAYSDAPKILAFVRAFPGADMSILRQIVPAKLRYLRGLIEGKIVWTTKINGVLQPRSEAAIAADIATAREDLEAWEEINAWLDQAA
jgi:hypothetical protein